MATDVEVPALGESITEGTLANWLKKPGDAVAADEGIAELETDKVSVEVTSPVAGVLAEQLVKAGDTVAVGSVIARVDEGGKAAPAPAPAEAAAVATTNPPGAGETPALRGDETAPVADQDDDQITTLSPAVRRAVLEYHVDPSSIKGTGKDGRLTKDDVIAAAEAMKSGSPAKAGAQTEAKASPAPAPSTPASRADWTPASAGEQRKEERVKMTRLRQTVARRLKEAQNTAAMLTTFNDVDMTAVIEARSRYKDLFEKKHGIRLGFMGFFVEACALAAKDVPAVNGSIEGDEIVYHDYLDVSIAVSAPKGLVVPVVGLWGRERPRRHGGVFGSLLSTPIINPPQSAVLGMHRIEERPVAKDGQVVIRPMMYLALSYDHRLVDGREAVTFLVRVKEAIEDPTRILIDL